MSVVLQPGVTGFVNADKHPGLPRVEFAKFKRIVYAAFGHSGTGVESVTEQQIARNYHSAVIACSDRHQASRVMLVGNAVYPFFAFTEILEPGNLLLNFKDIPELSDRLEHLDGVTVLSAVELSQSPKAADLSQLTPVELREIKSWAPATIGEIIFNWWD